MSDYTAWNGSSMTQAEADLRLAYRGIKDELEDLEREVEKHLQQWTGTARESYTSAKSDWHTATDELNHILGTLGVAVRDIHDNYSQAERDNQTIFD